MVSFLQLWENMSDDREQHAHADTKAMRAIRTGINTREDFWDNFITVTNNADGLADLLGVREDQVRSWGARVKDSLDKVHNADDNGEGEEKPKTKVLDTGELPTFGGISMGS
jgi:hypothetical protein